MENGLKGGEAVELLIFTMGKIYVGPAGVPISCKERSTIAGIKRVAELGLNAMELECVRRTMSATLAAQVRKVAEENKIKLTVHASYFINLNSADPEKLEASKQRILQSARIGNIAGAGSVTFHPAYYMGQKPEIVYKKVKTALIEITKVLKQEGNKIRISPETTGKVSQFGNLNEILNLAAEIDQVWPCIDFAHLHARTGKLNSLEEFQNILTQVEDKLGKRGLQNLHMHLSGIEYGSKGEKNHLNLSDSDFKLKELLKALKEFKVSGIIICESPNLEGDALLIKNLLASI